jgi:hypothetical protein
MRAGYRRGVSEPPTAAEIAKVLRAYLRDDRLTAMPRRGRRRQILLEHIVQRFEPGQRYSEVEVNAQLRPMWGDVAALRRYLVDSSLLARSDGEYWRIGGRVDV